MILYPRSREELRRVAYVAQGRAGAGSSQYGEILFWNPSGSGVVVALHRLALTIDSAQFVEVYVRTGGTEPFDNAVDTSRSCYAMGTAGALEVHTQVPTSQTAPGGSDFTFAQLYLGNIGALNNLLLPVPLLLDEGEGLWIRGNTTNDPVAAWVNLLEQAP